MKPGDLIREAEELWYLGRAEPRLGLVLTEGRVFSFDRRGGPWHLVLWEDGQIGWEYSGGEAGRDITIL